MAEFSERLQADVDRFRERVYTDPVGVLDPEDLHHEFVSGNHGRKLDYDKIEIGTDFYIEWVTVYARAVKEMYPMRSPDALVGIANGANRLSRDVGHLLGIASLTTVKVSAKEVKLDDDALETIEEYGIKFALTIEDVGTTGGTTVTAVNDLRLAGVPRIESVNFHQRNLVLPKLVAARTPHDSVIIDPLPMFSATECMTAPDGYCGSGVLLIPHAA